MLISFLQKDKTTNTNEELERLKAHLNELRMQLESCETLFNYYQNNDMIDSIIYKINSLKVAESFVLKSIKDIEDKSSAEILTKISV